MENSCLAERPAQHNEIMVTQPSPYTSGAATLASNRNIHTKYLYKRLLSATQTAQKMPCLTRIIFIIIVAKTIM